MDILDFERISTENIFIDGSYDNIFLKLKLNKQKSGVLNIVSAIIKDKDGKWLLLQSKKYGWWLNAGGKIDDGETPQDALYREIEEELGVKVKSDNYIGALQMIHNSCPICMYYFEVTLDGPAVIKEPHKHSGLKWFEFLPSPNKLGFEVRIDNIILDGEDDILNNFTDYYLVEKVLSSFISNDKSLLDSELYFLIPVKFPLSNTEIGDLFDENTIYVTVFDRTENCYIILPESNLNQYFETHYEGSDFIIIFKQKGKEFKNLIFYDKN